MEVCFNPIISLYIASVSHSKAEKESLNGKPNEHYGNLGPLNLPAALGT